MSVFTKEYLLSDNQRIRHSFGQAIKPSPFAMTEDAKRANNDAFWRFSDLEMLLRRFAWEFGYHFIAHIPENLDLAIYTSALAKSDGQFTPEVESTLKEGLLEDENFADQAVAYSLDRLAGIIPEEILLIDDDDINAPDNLTDQMHIEIESDNKIKRAVYTAVMTAALPSTLLRYKEIFDSGIPAIGAELLPFYRSISSLIPIPSAIDQQQDISLIRTGTAYDGNILWEIEFNAGFLGLGQMYNILGSRTMKIHPLFNTNPSQLTTIESGMEQLFKIESTKFAPAVRCLAKAARDRGKNIIDAHFINKDPKLNGAIMAYKLYKENAWGAFEYMMYDTFDFLNESDISDILTEVGCSDSIEALTMKVRVYDGLSLLLISCGMTAAWDAFVAHVSQLLKPNEKSSMSSSTKAPDPERFRALNY